MADLKSAQRLCALALVAAIEDDRPECYRLIVQAAKAPERKFAVHVPAKVMEWKRDVCALSVSDAFQALLRADGRPTDEFLREAEFWLSHAASVAWPGEEAARAKGAEWKVRPEYGRCEDTTIGSYPMAVFAGDGDTEGTFAWVAMGLSRGEESSIRGARLSALRAALADCEKTQRELREAIAAEEENRV